MMTKQTKQSFEMKLRQGRQLEELMQRQKVYLIYIITLIDNIWMLFSSIGTVYTALVTSCKASLL